MDSQEKRRLRLLMHRLEFGLPRGDWQELYDFCTRVQVTDESIASAVMSDTSDAEDVCRKLISLWKEHEGTSSERVRSLWRLGIKIKKSAGGMDGGPGKDSGAGKDSGHGNDRKQADAG